MIIKNNHLGTSKQITDHWAILYYWRTCSAKRSEAKNMADFGLCWRHFRDNWSVFLIVITTDQARIGVQYTIQYPHPLVFWKNFRFLQFCSGFIVFSRWFESIFKMFSGHFFLNLVTGSKMCKSCVWFFTGKTTKSKFRTEIILSKENIWINEL